MTKFLQSSTERERIVRVDITLNCEGVVCGDVLLTKLTQREYREYTR